MRKRIFILSAMSALLAFGLIASSAMATHEHPSNLGGASPIRVPLVPSFEACTSADSTHGIPLNFPSCNPPVPSSSTVKSGTGSVGQGWVVVCNTGSAVAECNTAAGGGFTTAMQPDVRLYGAGRDVQCRVTGTPLGCSAGSDYNPNGSPGPSPYTTTCSTAAACSFNGRPNPFCAPGGAPNACAASADLTETAELGAPAGSSVDPTAECGTVATCLAFAGHFVGHAIRVTDHYNCDPLAGGTDPNRCPAVAGRNNRPATLIDILFPVPVDCLPTTATALGSVCGSNTTANALVPGSVIANQEAVVEVGEVVALDSGPNGSRGDSDDDVFATQGIYLP